uniref:Reverse transcriptase domain-containing protein n=1 Tax=Haemonchus contortus TaxID=6289 RepID=A0A7I4YVT3_HAECO
MSKASKSIRDKARTSPGSGAQGPRLSSVDSKRGLPRRERPRPKKLVRIGTLNGAKAREIGKGVKLFYNGEETKRNGVAVAVADSLKDSVSAVNRVSSRIISVKIDTKEGNWTIISVYAPQAGCPIYEKDEFYLSLDENIRSVPEGDYLTIAGDLNGHVGSERRGLERVHGGDGVGVRNDEGERVLALAIAHDLAVCSTFFAKRKTQKVTYRRKLQQWRERNGNRSCAGKKIVPQNYKRHQGTARRRLGTTAQTSTSRNSHRSSQEIEDKNGTEDPVVEVAPVRKRKPQRKDTGSWTSKSRRADPADLEQRCGGHPAMCKGNAGGNSRQKKSAYKRWQKTRAPEDLAAYRTSKRLAKAAIAKAKNTELDDLYEKLDSREGEKFIYRLAKARQRATRDIGVVKSVRNSEGAILRKPGEVRRGWKEYFDGLLNEDFARKNSFQSEARLAQQSLDRE